VRKDQAAPLTKIAKGGEIAATRKLERFVLSPEHGKLLLDGDPSDTAYEVRERLPTLPLSTLISKAWRSRVFAGPWRPGLCRCCRGKRI
jgi:hypothetical protein